MDISKASWSRRKFKCEGVAIDIVSMDVSINIVSMDRFRYSR